MTIKMWQFFTVRSDPEFAGILLLVQDNVAAAKVKGFEVELEARPVTRLSINGSAGYNDFEITNVKPGTVGISTDTKMLRTPEWTANAGIEYTFPSTSIGMFTVRGDWQYESLSYADIDNTPEIARKAHSLFNARLTWQYNDHWQLSAFGTNFTDKRVVTNGIQAVDAFGTIEGFYNRPREWGLSLQASF